MLILARAKPGSWYSRHMNNDAFAKEAEQDFVGFLIAEVDRATPPASPTDILTYRIPLLGPGGSCSIKDELDPNPFDLREWSGSSKQDLLRVARLDRLVEALHERSGADWSGIYRRSADPAGGETLVKEAYRGRPSRPLFPLTEDFAKISNNVTAVLEASSILVEDVEDHIATGGSYYECDASVRSEFCWPIMDGTSVIGLIDLESFESSWFTEARRELARAVGRVIVEKDLFRLRR